MKESFYDANIVPEIYSGSDEEAESLTRQRITAGKYPDPEPFGPFLQSEPAETAKQGESRPGAEL